MCREHLHGPATSSVTNFTLSKAGDNEAGGFNDGCFWTTVSSGTCAKAVCSSLSLRLNMEWGVKEKKITIVNLSGN